MADRPRSIIQLGQFVSLVSTHQSRGSMDSDSGNGFSVFMLFPVIPFYLLGIGVHLINCYNHGLPGLRLLWPSWKNDAALRFCLGLMCSFYIIFWPVFLTSYLTFKAFSWCFDANTVCGITIHSSRQRLRSWGALNPNPGEVEVNSQGYHRLSAESMSALDGRGDVELGSPVREELHKDVDTKAQDPPEWGDVANSAAPPPYDG